VVKGVGLRPLACWDCGSESRKRHGCLSVVGVVCFQVRGLCGGAIARPGESIDCNVSECCLETSTMRKPTRAVES
jgi:hypothetical protein